MWPPLENRAARVRQCLDRQIDWPHFLRVVNRHRIDGLVNHAFARTESGQVPAAVMLALKERAETLARQGLRAAQEASRLSAILQNTGIPFIVLKGAPLASPAAPAAGDQVEDQNDQRYNQQKVNQAAGYMEAETQQPQNQENYENCPKHGCALSAPQAPGIQSSSQAPTGISERLLS
jgi:hypothetical protein